MFLQRICVGIIFCLIQTTSMVGQTSSFEVVPLGVKGGNDESNLSSYLVAATGSKQYVALDAGTIQAGLDKAVQQKTFAVPAIQALRKYIKGYCISHAHLDHVSGLIINSPADSNKTVYAIQSCMSLMQQHYFNDKTWANFGDQGIGNFLKKYHFETLVPNQEIALQGTSMFVTPFVLSHVHPYESTAFLVRNGDASLLYLGDTGPDAVEQGGRLLALWRAVAPLIQTQKLKGIFIEVSFPNEQPDKFLFGHLTPRWLMQEMQVLASLVEEKSLKGFPVVITHQKPPVANEKKIVAQLKAYNPLGLRLIFPQQGKRLEF